MQKFGLLSVVLSALVACDGSGLEPGQRVERVPETDASAGAPDTEPAETVPDEATSPAPDLPPIEVTDPLQPAEPVQPTVLPLPSGTSDGSGLVVKRTELEGRFLYGMGADPSGLIANFGGGAAGLLPVRAKVVLAPAESGGGTFEVRALNRAGEPIASASGLLTSHPYSDVDADTIRVDFATTGTPLEIAIYGSCRLERTDYELHAPPVYADGLLTWPADERYERAGECQWVPRESIGLHVHYLRSDLAGRDYVARAADPEAPFGFFMTDDQVALARMPGIAADEPAKTYTYYLVDFPEAMIPAAERTFEAWNDTLEDATGRRPFVTKVAPDGIIAWDPRYHAVVWAEGGGGAVAPFTNDPETGETFQSLVVMWFTDLDDLVDTYRDFFNEYPAVAESLAPTPGPAALPAFGGFDHRAATAVQDISLRPVARADVEPRVLTTRTFMKRPLGPRDLREVARDYTDDELSEVIVVDFLLHELGHNLGLRHNFIGSVDKHRHLETQTSSTTMDYVLGMGEPGSYDRDAMRYGYGIGDQGARSTDYLYCTDETMDLDPACVQWDLGHPIRYQLGVIEAYLAAYGPKDDADDIEEALQYFDPELNRARSFINTEYESWDETPVATFDALVAMIDCRDACETHPALRASMALYLLYSRHIVTAWWEPGYPDIWLDYPTYTTTQTAVLADTYFSIVTSGDEPVELRTAIVGKLPTSAVSGAVELLGALHEHYSALPTLSGDDATVKAAVEDAFGSL